jgi:hypothetical protein
VAVAVARMDATARAMSQPGGSRGSSRPESNGAAAVVSGVEMGRGAAGGVVGAGSAVVGGAELGGGPTVLWVVGGAVVGVVVAAGAGPMARPRSMRP